MPLPTRVGGRRAGWAALASLALATTGIAAPAHAAEDGSVAAQPYGSVELQARTNLLVNDNGWNLPPGSSFNSITPDLNDEGVVAFRVQMVPVEGAPGQNAPAVWSGGHGNGHLVFTGEPGQMVTDDPELNAGGDLAFTLSNGGVDNVLYRYDASTGASGQVGTSPVLPDSYGDPSLDDDGAISFRANFGTGKAYAGAVNGRGEFFVQDRGLDPDSEWTYLYTPSFTNDGRIAAKVATSDDLYSKQEIRLFERDGSSELLLANHAVDPDSPYEEFNNSLGVNDNGTVAVVATRTDGTQVVVRSDGETTTEIAGAASNGTVRELDYFAPDINDDGLVAFRGADATGDAIFVGNGSSVTRVVGKGDVVETDLGTGQLGQHDDSPTFGGAPTLNDHGDLVFTAGIHPQGNNQVEWGSGVFVAYADTAEQPPADARISGVVTDGNDGLGVSGATITVTDDNGDEVDTTTSDDQGHYALDVEAGTYTLTASADRYAEAAQRVTVAADGQQQVDFSLATAIITVSPDELSFDAADGTSQTGDLTVTNEGSAPLTWQADARDWLSPSPDAGSLAPGQSATVTVTVDASNLDEGSYTQELTISGDAARTPTVGIPVTLVVGADDPGDPGEPGDPGTFRERVNLGGGEYTDHDGNVWAAEQASTGGSSGYLGGRSKVHRVGAKIAGTDDDGLFQDSRRKARAYLFTDVPAGHYDVDLGYVAVGTGLHGPTARHRMVSVDHPGGALVVDLDLSTGPGAGSGAHALGGGVSSIAVTPADAG